VTCGMDTTAPDSLKPMGGD